jgi:6-phosphogluconolactonase
MKLFMLSVLTMGMLASFAQDNYMLVGTYTRGKSEGIYVYKFNSSTGEINQVSTVFSENPSYLAISPDKKYVYAANESGKGKGGVSAFSFDKATGKLTAINQQSSNGDDPCYISVDKSNKFVVVGNYSGGNFSVYPIQQDGGIGEAVQTIQHTGMSVNKERQEGPHVHSVVFSPDGKYLTVVDLGTDKITLYPFDSNKPKPVTEKGIETSSSPGSGPRHIIFHPTDSYAYVIEEISGNVSAYKVENGSLSRIQTINSHPDNYKGSIGSAAIKISHDGKMLFASNRGESNTISVFTIDGLTGKLTSKGFINSGGKGPRDFNIDPSDNFLIAANGNSDNITIFKINKKTGMPEDAGKQVSIPSPVCIVFL